MHSLTPIARLGAFVTFSCLCFTTSLGASGSSELLAGWHGDLRSAQQQALEEDKFLLVDLYADWCGWCRRLEQDVFADPQFKAYGDLFAKLKVDVEDGGEGSRLQSRYGASSLPTTLILSPNMVLVEAIRGYAPRETFMSHMKRSIAEYRKQEVLYDRLLAEADLEVLEPLARTLHQQGDGARAAQIYRKTLAERQQTPQERAWNLYRLADALRLDGDLKEARRALKDSRLRAIDARDSTLVEACDLLTIQLAQDGGLCDETTLALEAFLDTYPKSNHRRNAQRALAAIANNPPADCT
ncbi:MAG: thioredoxin family protein [Deltaproteobacteria bacterium]|nr:thioredoxin family protein [Deltaproteobacteria bacterium]